MFRLPRYPRLMSNLFEDYDMAIGDEEEERGEIFTTEEVMAEMQQRLAHFKAQSE